MMRVKQKCRQNEETDKGKEDEQENEALAQVNLDFSNEDRDWLKAAQRLDADVWPRERLRDTGRVRRTPRKAD